MLESPMLDWFGSLKAIGLMGHGEQLKPLAKVQSQLEKKLQHLGDARTVG